MQTELIGRHTAKVTLSARELRSFGLDRESICADEDRTGSLMAYITDELLRTHGFDLRGKEICMGIVPASHGGCVIYITAGNSTVRRKRVRKMRGERPEIVFSCAAARELADCAALLKKRAGGIIAESSLFMSAEDFRIVVSLDVPSGSGKFPQSVTAAYTREHYSMLIENGALEKLTV